MTGGYAARGVTGLLVRRIQTPSNASGAALETDDGRPELAAVVPAARSAADGAYVGHAAAALAANGAASDCHDAGSALRAASPRGMTDTPSSATTCRSAAVFDVPSPRPPVRHRGPALRRRVGAQLPHTAWLGWRRSRRRRLSCSPRISRGWPHPAAPGAAPALPPGRSATHGGEPPDWWTTDAEAGLVLRDFPARYTAKKSLWFRLGWPIRWVDGSRMPASRTSS